MTDSHISDSATYASEGPITTQEAIWPNQPISKDDTFLSDFLNGDMQQTNQSLLKKLRRYSLLYGLVKGAKGKLENFDDRNDLDDLNVEDDETIKDEIKVYNDWKELESAKYLLMDLLRELNKELGEY